MTTPLHISNHVEEKSDDYKHCKHNNKIKIDNYDEYNSAYAWSDARPILKYVSFFTGDSRDGATMVNLQIFYLLNVLKVNHLQISKLSTGYGVCQFISMGIAGYLYDYTPNKGVVFLQLALVVNTVCILLVTYIATVEEENFDNQNPWNALIRTLFLIKCVQGVASAFIPTGMTAITLGIVGLSHLTDQHTTNRMFAHLGSAVVVMVMAVAGSFLYAKRDYGKVPFIFIVSILLTVPTITLLRRIRRSDVNSDAARGLIVESPTFLGYEGLKGTCDVDESEGFDDADINDFVKSDRQPYVPPVALPITPDASNLDVSKIENRTTSLDPNREQINEARINTFNETQQPKKLRSFLDKTNELKKNPSVLLESVRSGAHRKIKSITWSIKRKAASPLEVMSEKRLLMLIYVLFLFHLSNTSITPLIMNNIYLENDKLEVRFLLSGSVVFIAQGFMTLSSKFTGDYSPIWGRKPLALIGLFCLPLRCALLAVLFYFKQFYNHNPYLEGLVLSTQLIDDVGMGIIDTIYILVASDITAKTGRFSLVIGVTSAAASLGGVLSIYIGNSMANDVGLMSTFILIGTLSLVPAFLYMSCIPETLQDYEKYGKRRRVFGWLKKSNIELPKKAASPVKTISFEIV